MGFLKDMIKTAVGDGISKGIRDAVGKAAESIVAPKAEAYANKMAESLENATKESEEAISSAAAQAEGEKKGGFASLENAFQRMSQAAEKYAKTLENATMSQEELAKEWKEKVPGFPVWCFGGSEFSFQITGTSSDGNPYVVFCVENATQEGLNLYTALLKEEGFILEKAVKTTVFLTDMADFKEVNGEYLVFSKVEAFNAAPTMTVTLLRTKDRTEFEN